MEELLLNEGGNNSQICGDTDPPFGAFDEKADRIACVMSDGKRVDRKILDGERLASLKLDDLRFFEARLELPACQTTDDKGDPEPAPQCAGPPGVVMVFVTDQDGIEIAARHADERKPVEKFRCGEPAIYQELCGAGFYINRVPFAAAPEQTDPHNPSRTPSIEALEPEQCLGTGGS